LIGDVGEGLKRMFTLMNIQRLEVALQGVGRLDLIFHWICGAREDFAQVANLDNDRL
jgi:hypothetical protein